MCELISFEDSLKIAKETEQPIHLLLGNGFSMAYDSDIFGYSSLYKKVFPSDDELRVTNAFRIFETKDFELAINSLKEASLLIKAYGGGDNEMAIELLEDAETIREKLIEAISKLHPENVGSISEPKFENCKIFLSNFYNIFSLNYDLLLYWVLNHTDLTMSHGDGFRRYKKEISANYIGKIEKIIFLHGALHLYSDGLEVNKLCSKPHEKNLVEQIKEKIRNDNIPLLVAEGSYKEKLEKIDNNSYLRDGLKKIKSISDTLFLYGWGFSDNDTHILKAIAVSNISLLFVSLHGDKNSDKNKEIKEKVEQLKHTYHSYHPSDELTVYFYDADSTNIWG